MWCGGGCGGVRSGWGGGYTELSNILISIHFSSSSPTYICAFKLLKKIVYLVKYTCTYFLHPASMFARPQVLNPSHMLRFNTCSSERCPNHLQSKRRKKLIHTCNLISFFEKPGHKEENGMDAIYHRFQFYSKICLEHSPLH